MTALRCSICKNPMVRRMVDPMLAEGVTAATISRQFEGIGASVSPDRINNHRRHYRDDQPLAPKGTRKTDLAVLVRDRAIELFESEELDLTNKDHTSGINVGLKAQKVIEDREKEKAKSGRSQELLAALFSIVGLGPAPLALDDGNTIEGEAVEVDGTPD